MKNRLFILLLFVLVFTDHIYAQMQTDKSDTLWQIVRPLVSCSDINMNQCILGTVKDSVFDTFISNSGSWRFRVDSVYFRSGDSNSFSLVSGLPKYTIEPGNYKPTEFRFIPERIGIHQSEIVIITQNDTIYRNITGEGVKQYLQVMTNIIDFGKVEIGDDIILTDTVVLKNISDEEVTITNTIQLPPDVEQFFILSGGGHFTLLPEETRVMTLQFKPKYGGRTSGRIGFEFNNTGSPATADLFGTGIGGLVYVANDSGYAGEKKNIKLQLKDIKPEGISAIAGNFSAVLRFQKTLLTSVNNSNLIIEKDSIYLTIEGKIGNTTELISVPLIVGLGNVEETMIDIVEFYLKDNSENIVNYDIETKSGLFKLLGVCEEGGKRLFNSDGQVVLHQVKPNPATGAFEIDINLIEKGPTEIYLTNTIGQKVVDVFNGNIESAGFYQYNISTGNLANGIYYIVLQTPTIKKLEKIIIEK